MSEPRPQPEEPGRPGGAPASPTPPDPDLEDFTQLGAAEPTDDSPTIISRNVSRALPPDDALSGGLRGRRLAHFELIEPIGVGGMAAVLRARDTQLDRFVALKVLPPEMAQDAENVRRFHQEARSAAKLDHENIARVFFCGEDQRLHFIAFEFVEGENLRTVLERRGRLPVNEAVHSMLQVAAGLAHAARRGVVHRDIKPSNIIITPNGRAKLVDMGLARSLEPQGDNGLTQSGVTLGTFDYISPEQALEPRDADVRSDIYSLGCTFYHVLTGRPPVPEGTAAKKLHHHQHVRPPDPRQFVPDLPDEVAIILDRMMAKHPKDRYQAPEHLVHHLLLAARKLGATPEVPEGVLSVEAALPSPPGSRPLLLAALAAAAVVLLIFLIDQSPPRGGRLGVGGPQGLPAGPEDGVSQPAVSQPSDQDLPVRPSQKVEPPRIVYAPTWVTYDSDPPSAQGLSQWLREQAAKGRKDYLEIVLGGDLDLNGLVGQDEPGLVVKAPRVRIRAKKSLTYRPTIRLTYDSSSGYRKEPWAALTIESESKVEVEGLRFVVDGREADVAMVGLWLRGGSPNSDNNTVSRCEFVQAKPAYNDKRMASVVVEATRDFGVTLRRCCFYLGLPERGQPDDLKEASSRGGQDAVVRRGAARILAEDCAFGPHAATFRLEGGTDEPPPLLVSHCSVMAGRNSAVFYLTDPRAGAVLDVRASLFARPGEADLGDMMMEPRKGGAVLIRGGTPNELTYKDSDNRYYLDGYWPDAGAGEEAGWENFRGKVKETKDSRPLAAAPWKDPQPLKRLEPQKLEQAFRVDWGSADLRLGSRGEHLAGAEYLAEFSYLADLPPLQDRRAETRVVDPRVVTNSGAGIYSSLEAAVAEARPGDEIQIKAQGELRIDPVQLKRKDLSDLTLRPFPGYHPVLTFGETTDSDAVLFQVQDGRLQLVDLEFLLRPREQFEVQALVALAGNGQCLFKNCAITLDRGGQKTALAVATVPEVGKVMKVEMPTARPREQGPQLSFENCFVRGDGDLVWGRTSRPFELAAAGTLAALTGSFLHVGEVRAEAPAAPPGQKVVVKLKDVTTYLGGHLVRVRAERDLKGLVPIDCRATNCLFVPHSAGRALVQLDVPETDEKALKDKLQWNGERSAYGRFDPMLEQQTAGEEMPVLAFDDKKWQTFFGESGGRFDVRLAAPLAELGALPKVLPARFRPAEDVQGFGADLMKLPRPARRGVEPK